MRSGSTLQYNIASEIIERRKLGNREVWIDDHEKYFNFISPDEITVFKSHILTDTLRQLLQDGRAKAVVVRDIRDSTASWQAKNKEHLTLEKGLDFARHTMYLLNSWEKLPANSILISKYEKIVIDVPEEVSRIASWLDIELSQSEISDIAAIVDSSSLEALLNNSKDDDFVRD